MAAQPQAHAHVLDHPVQGCSSDEIRKWIGRDQLDVVIERHEDDEWYAVALANGIAGYGATPAEAEADLAGLLQGRFVHAYLNGRSARSVGAPLSVGRRLLMRTSALLVAALGGRGPALLRWRGVVSLPIGDQPALRN
ncbi:hypothetical protein [Baekduia sp. Peel2402]|uniref:hypothetical protein n=1 Tax=Baekduia sp. Peel2402 TaxID=3458296 RepID=UPI00403EB131